MDLLAKKRVLSVLILAGTASAVCADDLFKMPMIDYFGIKAVPRAGQQDRFITSASGHELPPAVADLLDDPTEQTARSYLAWHRARLKKIVDAQHMVEAVEALMPFGEDE
jgi:hypothetical protein